MVPVAATYPLKDVAMAQLALRNGNKGPGKIVPEVTNDTWARGVPHDSGPIPASLLSEDNCWVNAQRIEISGGVALQKSELHSSFTDLPAKPNVRPRGKGTFYVLREAC